MGRDNPGAPIIAASEPVWRRGPIFVGFVVLEVSYQDLLEDPGRSDT